MNFIYIKVILLYIKMDSKEKLIKTIQEWVKLDNDIRKLRSEATLRKTEQDKITKSLMNTMKTNEIDEFNISNGKITYLNKTVKKPINKKNLLDILSKFYKGNNEKVSELNQFILDNREDVVVEKLVRKISPINISKPQQE
jgi:DNA repair ATPase RecN